MSGTGNIPDGIRFEIHEALDRLYTQGYRATRVIIARRYQELISGYLERRRLAGQSEQSVPACMVCRWILALTPKKNPAGSNYFDLEKSQVCLLPLFPFI